jgi:PKD repeat protein
VAQADGGSFVLSGTKYMSHGILLSSGTYNAFLAKCDTIGKVYPYARFKANSTSGFFPMAVQLTDQILDATEWL